MSWGRHAEASKAAKWLLRQSFKSQEQSDAQTVYLLNLLQEQRQELEARDAVMRESTVLVSKLQLELEALREQLGEERLQPSGSSDTSEQRPKQGTRPPTEAINSEGGSPALASWLHRRAGREADVPRGTGSVGGWDGSSSSSARTGTVHTCGTLEEAWSRMRRGSHAPSPLQKTIPRGGDGSSEASGEAASSPCTPQPSSHSPLDLRLSSSSSAAVSSSPLTSQPCATAASAPSPASSTPMAASNAPSSQAGGSTCAAAGANEPPPSAARVIPEDHTLQPNPPSQLPQQQSSPSPQLLPTRQPQPLMSHQQPQQPQAPPQVPQLPHHHRDPHDAQVQSLTALVASLQSQLGAARHSASEATSNYLTCRKDLEILTRKYESLMLQKLEVEEQRDRLFSPHLDIQVIRAAMPSVDAAMVAVEARLEAAADMLATCHAEAEDAARVQNQQRRKWITRLEGLQAQLVAREARLSEVEAQLAAVQGAAGARGFRPGQDQTESSSGASACRGAGKACAAGAMGRGSGGGSACAPAQGVLAWVGGAPLCGWADGRQGQGDASSGGGSVASCGTTSSSGGSGTSNSRSSSGSIRSSGGGGGAGTGSEMSPISLPGDVCAPKLSVE